MNISTGHKNLIMGASFEDSNLITTPYQYMGRYYKLDGNAIDSSANKIDGQVNGAIPATDRHGNPEGCMYFGSGTTATTTNITCGDLTAIDLNRYVGWAFSVWVKLESLSGGTIFSALKGSVDGYSISYDPDYSGFTYYNSTSVSAYDLYYVPYTTVNEWVHLVFNINRYPDQSTIYLNGVKQTITYVSDTFGGQIYQDGNPKIGNGLSNNSQFHGWIDDLQIYNWGAYLTGRALTQDEINSIYNNGQFFTDLYENKNGGTIYGIRYNPISNRYGQDHRAIFNTNHNTGFVPYGKKLTQFTLFRRVSRYVGSSTTYYASLDDGTNTMTFYTYADNSYRVAYNINGLSNTYTNVTYFSNIPEGDWVDLFVIGDITSPYLFENPMYYKDGLEVNYKISTTMPDYYLNGDIRFISNFNGGISNFLLFDRALTKDEMFTLHRTNL